MCSDQIVIDDDDDGGEVDKNKCANEFQLQIEKKCWGKKSALSFPPTNFTI